MPNVWRNVSQELDRRRMNAAWLARKIGASRQVVSGWKRRGVPAARYEEIASLFGWSLDRLVSGADVSAEAVQDAPAVAETYSPMALDLARTLDDIPDIEKKQRAYALMLQIARIDGGPSPLVPTASAPARKTAALGALPMRDPHPHK